jgi:hypothetical protein
MAGQFLIDVDVPRDLVRITMSGFFGEPEILAFLGERMMAHRRLQCGPNQHLTLNDMRAMDIRSQQAVESFRSILASPEYRSRRLAFVVGPTLARTQVVRALANRHARIFEDFWSAEAWLFAPDESPV